MNGNIIFSIELVFWNTKQLEYLMFLDIEIPYK